MDTLLVYEKIPEDTSFYLLPEAVAKRYEGFLQAADGKIVNQDESNDGMEFLQAALCENKEYVDEEWKKYGGVLFPYKKTLAELKGIQVSCVIHSGFAL